MSVEVKVPAVFEENLFYERLIQMRQTDRRTFDLLSTPTHYALVEYEKQKRAHEQEQEMKK